MPSSTSPSARISAEDQRCGGQDPFGTASLETQFGGDLMPAVADLPEHVVIGDEHVGEDDLVEMVLAVHQHDWADRDARRRSLHDELREARVPMLRVQWAGSGQHDDLMRDVRAARPYLRPVEHPAAVGSGGPGLRGREVRPRAVLAHPDRRIELRRRDPRQ